MDERVLIVGAGPSGLVMALWLAHFGIPLRIIDKSAGPGETSRAMAVHARTLEFYQQLGFADEAIAKGMFVEHINVRKSGHVVATVNIGPLGKNLSPFPYVLSLPQDDHEKMLIEQLLKKGVPVERNTELVSFTEDAHTVSAVIKKQDTTETITTPFLLGCDGARSTVRIQSGLDFKGGTYEQIFYVADVMATGDVVNGYMQLCLGDDDFTLAFPIRSSGSIRLIGIVPKEKQNNATIEFTDVAPVAIRDTKITISQVNWFSTYHSHHRVANHFRKGRAFLAGDAGHIHSPVGGQGMNTGIGDATNLAWKIAAVLQKRADDTILDTYEMERIRFAKQLVATTDRMFQAVTSEGLPGKFCRNVFFPHIFPFLVRFETLRHFLFNTVSQTRIHYRFSSLSQGAAGKIHSGDRLPWVTDGASDNFASLKLLDWQVHIYGDAADVFKQEIHALGLTLQQFPWSEEASRKGLIKNAAYLIRPDGYVGYASDAQESLPIKAYLETYKIVPMACVSS